MTTRLRDIADRSFKGRMLYALRDRATAHCLSELDVQTVHRMALAPMADWPEREVEAMERASDEIVGVYADCAMGIYLSRMGMLAA